MVHGHVERRVHLIVNRYMFGTRPSIRASMVADLIRVIEGACLDAAEDAREEVLEEFADIIHALEVAANA